MNYRKSFKKLITGLTIHQQYVCLALESLQQPLSVKLVVDAGKTTIDVTHSHVLLGYKPVVIGLFFSSQHNTEILSEENVTLRFYHDYKSGDSSRRNASVACLKLRRCREQINHVHVTLYQAVQGHHCFINPFHQFANQLRYKFEKENASNITLQGNERDQVRITYAVPRTISLITVSKDDLMNLFPTDLHGPVGKDFYVSSLRVNGNANEQVSDVGRIVLAEMDAGYFRDVYSLGKNHMKEMKAFDQFQILPERSKAFGFPLPVGLTRYRELEVVDSCHIGIHHIYFYDTVSEITVNEGETLTHIDQYYAQWRADHKLITSMLFR